MDTFRCAWDDEINFVVPPIYLIPRVLKHMQYYHAVGTLVLPHWSSAPFWPLLLQNPSTLKPFVKAVFYFCNPSNCVHPGKNVKCVIGSETFKSPILALRISFQ